MIRILVVDDHCLIRRGLESVLSDTPDLRVMGEASTGEEALELVRSQSFDLVILDVAMPGRGGIDALRDIRLSVPHIKVIILSASEEESIAIRAFRDGAMAFINKRESLELLLLAIRTVLSGQRYITERVADVLARYVVQGLDRPLHDRLTTREMQVLMLLGEGYSPKKIAGELCLSVKTVNTYRARLKEKLNLESNAEMIKYAISNHLVP